MENIIRQEPSNPKTAETAAQDMAAEESQAAELEVTDPGAEEPVEPGETVPEAEPECGISPQELERQLAEAEQRGYLRAMNEMAAAQMSKPVLLENPSLRTAASHSPSAPDLRSGFLATLRKNVWD